MLCDNQPAPFLCASSLETLVRVWFTNIRAATMQVAQVYQIHDSWSKGSGMVGQCVDLPVAWVLLSVRPLAMRQMFLA